MRMQYFTPKKGIKKKVLESGSAKGISDGLYEITWNEKEKEQTKPEIYRKKIFAGFYIAILFQEREFVIFLKKQTEQYEKIILFCYFIRFI